MGVGIANALAQNFAYLANMAVDNINQFHRRRQELGIYCGAPQSLECFRVARKVLEENDLL